MQGLGAFLNLLILFVIVMVPIILITRMVGAAKKRKIREALAQLPIAELQAMARALWARDEKLEDVFVHRASATTMYGSDGEALMEVLMQRTFDQKNGFDEHYRVLVTHYTWLLGLLLRFLENNWSWVDATYNPTLDRYQIFYMQTVGRWTKPVSDSGPVNAKTPPSYAEARYPRPKNDLAATKLPETLIWLEPLAQQQRALRQQAERATAFPAWDAEIFACKPSSLAVGLTTLSLWEIRCPPAVLRKEIEKLSESPQPAPASG